MFSKMRTNVMETVYKRLTKPEEVQRVESAVDAVLNRKLAYKTMATRNNFRFNFFTSQELRTNIVDAVYRRVTHPDESLLVENNVHAMLNHVTPDKNNEKARLDEPSNFLPSYFADGATCSSNNFDDKNGVLYLKQECDESETKCSPLIDEKNIVESTSSFSCQACPFVPFEKSSNIIAAECGQPTSSNCGVKLEMNDSFLNELNSELRCDRLDIANKNNTMCDYLFPTADNLIDVPISCSFINDSDCSTNNSNSTWQNYDSGLGSFSNSVLLAEDVENIFALKDDPCSSSDVDFKNSEFSVKNLYCQEQHKVVVVVNVGCRNNSRVEIVENLENVPNETVSETVSPIIDIDYEKRIESCIRNVLQNKESGADDTIKCNLCKLTVSNDIDDAKRHIHDVHRSKKVFQCLLCEKIFLNYRWLQSHIFDVECGELQKSVTYEDCSESVEKLLAVCFPSLLRLSNLALVVDHVTFNNGKFICSFCSAELQCSSLCQYHALKHLKQAVGISWLYKCLFCYYDTVYWQSCIRHISRVHKIKGQLVLGVDYQEVDSREDIERQCLQRVFPSSH